MLLDTNSVKTKHCEQEQCCGGETHLQHATFYTVSTAHFLVAITEYLHRNVGLQFIPVEQICVKQPRHVGSGGQETITIRQHFTLEQTFLAFFGCRDDGLFH
jgi:argininosuccinate lyase